jgi:glycosyltransferase involved in cell wall biosynthesis
MKILYIANIRIPTEMAHGLQIMKMCEAFVEQGAELELVVPWRFGISEVAQKDPFAYYRVDKIFKIRKIFCLDLTPLNKYLGPVSFLIQAISFAISAFFYSLFKRIDIIYSRDRFSLLLLAMVKFIRRRGGKNIIMEIHQKHRSLFRFVLNKTEKIIVITSGLKEELVGGGNDENKILIAPDGIDLKDFDIPDSKETCRKKIGLPLDKEIVLYAGHLYKWKGAETLALASKFLSENILVVIVGGIKWYLSDFKKFVKKNNLKNVLVLGHKDYVQVPFYLKSADCLILTGTKNSQTSKQHTSPMKMFEYMASKNPIVASNLSSFREILNDENSLLVESDNPEAIAIGINKIINDRELSKRISERAYKDVQQYAWDNRAKKILEFICAE